MAKKRLIIVCLLGIFLLCCCISSFVGGVYAFTSLDIQIKDECFQGLKGLINDEKHECPLPDFDSPFGIIRPSTIKPEDLVTYGNLQVSFKYPYNWELSVPYNVGDPVVVSSPDGGSITFNMRDDEPTALTAEKCDAQAQNSLKQTQRAQSLTSAQVTGFSHQLTSLNGGNACMIDFRIEDKGSETDMVYARYYYFVNKSSAYLVLLATTDKDRFMPEMMDVVRSVNYNWPEN